ncbi:MAG: 50S ribosomal protein L32 [Candidatus Kerfeldbacteria bacterium]|nr:50S ribosomal protein L32 [Candidatus Kerfeldbacteria bacterium]
MSVPGKRRSRSTSGRRRSHDALAKLRPQSCPKCASPILPHHVCTNCGYYRGRKVLAIENPFAKKAEKRKKEKTEEKEKAASSAPEQKVKAS